MTVKSVTFAALTAVALAACGQAPAKSKAPAAPVVSGIFTSAQDCAAKGTNKLEICGKLIQRAINVHNTKTVSYLSERLCELAEGKGRCERSEGDKFRPKLLAFLLTFSTPPTADPLYPPKDRKVVGFQTADASKTILTVDETTIVSPSARAVAESITTAKLR
jgi:hypothetical protein